MNKDLSGISQVRPGDHKKLGHLKILAIYDSSLSQLSLAQSWDPITSQVYGTDFEEGS